MTNTAIQVMDNNDLITISFEDLLKYHGHNMIGGVALAYKVMLWGFPKLTDGIPRRGSFTFLSGIGPVGEGVIDAVEMVMRVKTQGTLCLDWEQVSDKPGPLTPGGKGRYYFELGYAGKTLCLALRDGVVPQEFYDVSLIPGLRRKAGLDLSEQDISDLTRVRNNLSDAILSSAPDDLFYIVSCD